MRTPDPLWPKFTALWARLGALEPALVLSGGYGVFLKQLFLLENAPTTTVVPLERWKTAPRSTRDFDFLLDVQLIAQQEKQRAIRVALDECGYTARTAHWQFEKNLDAQQSVQVDLLAPMPGKGVAGVQADTRRVKSKPSLGEHGVHAHTTPEAIGCDLHPFTFEWQGVTLRVPNSISWCVMKLHATRDRWQAAQNLETDAARRSGERAQAIKHAGDVLRLVALGTRQERAANREVCDRLRDEAAFGEARRIARMYFAGDEAILRGEREVVGAWEPDDFETILSVLKSWFPM